MSDTPGGPDERLRRAQAVRQAHQAELLRLPNVVGVGLGLRQRRGISTSRVALVVMVSRKVPLAQLTPDERIPGEIDGVEVDVQEMGEVMAQD